MTYILQEIDENGNVVKSKQFTTLKEISTVTGITYKRIQTLFYYSSGHLKYSGKKRSTVTNQLMDKYRIVEDVVEFKPIEF